MLERHPFTGLEPDMDGGEVVGLSIVGPCKQCGLPFLNPIHESSLGGTAASVGFMLVDGELKPTTER